MHTWFTILRTRRVVVRAHYTWLLLLVLGTWTLAQIALPARLPEARWLLPTALLIMTTFVGCVALHEAAHLLAARLLRIPLPVLSVSPLGDLERRGHEPAGPYRAAALAAAGPLANLALWAILRALDAGSGTMAVVVSYAAWFSLLLALINLLPGLPLDGGRLLRAAVWSASTLAAGTRVATGAGYVVSAGILLVGLRSLSAPETALRGVWLLLLAWLIYTAGAGLARRQTIGELLERLTARDIMTPAPYVATPRTTLAELVALWQGASGENYTPVVHEGALVGLISRSQAYDVPQGYWPERTVGRTMRPITAIATVPATTPLSEVLPEMDSAAFHPVPLLVVADGQLLGMIDPRAIEPYLDVQSEFGIATSRRAEPQLAPRPGSRGAQRLPGSPA